MERGWGLEHTRGGTRTRNLLRRREAPYPLGHTSSPCIWLQVCRSASALIKQRLAWYAAGAVALGAGGCLQQGGKRPRAQVIAKQALLQQDTLSEWLRRWTRNPLGSARKGSNPLGVALPQAPQTSTQPSRGCNSTATPLATQACGHSGAVEVWITQTRHASLLLLLPSQIYIMRTMHIGPL